MWMMVMFDLPVTSKPERKAAAAFRLGLLDAGFEMAQFSVYVRFCGSEERYEAIERRVVGRLPDRGRVQILRFTDRQYARSVLFHGRRAAPGPKKPSQLALF